MASPVKRRIGYTLSYETIAIVCTTGFLLLLGNDVGHSLPFAVVSSVVALVWNFTWNTIFEKMEKSFGWKGRTVPIRILHAIGFEGGLAAILVPILAWWMGVSLFEAFLTEFGLLAFFLFYTYIFNLSFDKIFGLPQSAQ